MSRYLLRFSKKGNIRFISHLDIYRLFCRTVRKLNIDIEFSNGYNPHEKLSLVQPLSLGFESDSEYLEISTNTDYEVKFLIDSLNSAMPEGLFFYDGKTVISDCSSITNLSSSAKYKILIKSSKDDYDKIDISSFINREEVLVLKRDKKTKTYKPKNVKDLIYEIDKSIYDNNEFSIYCNVKCATNESLNPLNLITAIFDFATLDINNFTYIINRMDLLSGEPILNISLYDSIV